MPHGESWFSVLFRNFYKNAEHSAHVLGWPLNDKGETWIGHGHIGLQHVFTSVFLLIVLAIFAAVVYSKRKDTASELLPEKKFSLATAIELIVGTTYSMMSDVMGKKAAKFFLPLIGTCALFILFGNALGVIPGFSPPTDNMNTTMACALVIFFATHIFGVKENGGAYFKHFLGPWLPLAPIMLPIEIISHIARPITLAIRLMANMTADHKVLAIFLSLVPFIVPLPIYVLGCIVVIVQALVFCLLATVYISMAIAHDH